MENVHFCYQKDRRYQQRLKDVFLALLCVFCEKQIGVDLEYGAHVSQGRYFCFFDKKGDNRNISFIEKKSCCCPKQRNLPENEFQLKRINLVEK